jgi:hypothetical protein
MFASLKGEDFVGDCISWYEYRQPDRHNCWQQDILKSRRQFFIYPPGLKEEEESSFATTRALRQSNMGLATNACPWNVNGSLHAAIQRLHSFAATSPSDCA